MTPRILKNFNVYVNGTSYRGRIDEFEQPEISLKMEEYRAGGMDGAVEIDMGMEVMTGKVTITDPDSALFKLFAAGGTRVLARGSFVRDSDNTRVAVMIEMNGRFKKFAGGTWKAGDKNSNEHEFAINYYRLVVGGEEIFEIDVENMVRRVGGVDQLAGQRSDIGL